MSLHLSEDKYYCENCNHLLEVIDVDQIQTVLHYGAVLLCQCFECECDKPK